MPLPIQIRHISKGWPPLLRYILTTEAILGAFLLRQVFFDDVTGYPFLLFYPVIIAAGALFDRGSGIYATLLAAILSVWFLLPFNHSVAEFRYDFGALFIFTGTGILAAFIVEALHKALMQVLEAHDKLSVEGEMRKLLLSEISHRMRNDLGVLTSILHLQSLTLEGVSAKKALAQAAERIRVLMRVQARLSIQSGSVVVESSEYIGALGEDLRTALLAGRPVAVDFAIEPHPLSHQKAVTLGLIINELITNAVKYGFPDNRSGKIQVVFKKEADEFTLCISDDGVGMAQAVADGKSTGVGLELTRTLASQLGGTLEIAPCPRGTRVEVSFPADA